MKPSVMCFETVVDGKASGSTSGSPASLRLLAASFALTSSCCNSITCSGSMVGSKYGQPTSKKAQDRTGRSRCTLPTKRQLRLKVQAVQAILLKSRPLLHGHRAGLPKRAQPMKPHGKARVAALHAPFYVVEQGPFIRIPPGNPNLVMKCSGQSGSTSSAAFCNEL